MSRRSVGCHCRARGMSLIEALVASALLAIGLMGLVRLWFFSYQVTVGSDDRAIAYNLGRQAIENVKTQGFFKAPEGTTTACYDATQSPATGTSGRYTVTTTITSSLAWPNDWARRTVAVTVKRTTSGALFYSTSTILVRGGV